MSRCSNSGTTEGESVSRWFSLAMGNLCRGGFPLRWEVRYQDYWLPVKAVTKKCTGDYLVIKCITLTTSCDKMEIMYRTLTQSAQKCINKLVI